MPRHCHNASGLENAKSSFKFQISDMWRGMTTETKIEKSKAGMEWGVRHRAILQVSRVEDGAALDSGAAEGEEKVPKKKMGARRFAMAGGLFAIFFLLCEEWTFGATVMGSLQDIS